MFLFKGSDKDFYAIWNFNKQSYIVFYKSKYFTTKYRFRDIVNYIGKNYIQTRLK